MTTIDRILVMLTGICAGAALALMLIAYNLISAKEYIAWFFMSAANICTIARFFTPKKDDKEDKQLFDFETGSELKKIIS